MKLNQNQYLEILYYHLMEKNNLIDKMLSIQIKKSVKEWENNFLNQFKKLYQKDFKKLILKLSRLSNTQVNKSENNDEAEALLFSFIWDEHKDESRLKDVLTYFKSSSQYALKFLNFWNLKYEIIKDLVPELPSFETIQNKTKNKSKWIIVAHFSGRLAQAASSQTKNYPIKYGELVIDEKQKNNDFWSISFTEVKENIIRILVYTKLDTKGRDLRLILSDQGIIYELAKLSDIEEDSQREFEVDIMQIPLYPWKINVKNYEHKVYIEEK